MIIPSDLYIYIYILGFPARHGSTPSSLDGEGKIHENPNLEMDDLTRA